VRERCGHSSKLPGHLLRCRYNLTERNCEHFSRWCKTGSTTSSQISVAWTSLGKVVVTVGLKAVGLLLVLGLLQYAHETQEQQVSAARPVADPQGAMGAIPPRKKEARTRLPSVGFRS